MATPADIQTWIDNLIAARMQGLRSVRDADGSQIDYKSDQEMAAAIAAATSMLSAASPPIKTIRFVTSKGL